MATNDIANNVAVTQLVDPATLTATTNSSSIDTQFDHGSMLICPEYLIYTNKES